MKSIGHIKHGPLEMCLLSQNVLEGTIICCPCGTSWVASVDHRWRRLEPRVEPCASWREGARR